MKRFGILLALFLSLTLGHVFAQDAHMLAMKGGDLTAEQVNKLEEKVAKEPTDITSRTKLLGYYFMNDRGGDKGKARHILWLIEHAPESEILATPYGTLDAIMNSEAYGNGKAAWQAQIAKQPENLKILEHAAQYFTLPDSDLAVECLQKAIKLDPENPQWHESLGHQYSLQMNAPSKKGRQKAAQMAFDEFQIAYELYTEREQSNLLPDLATTAFYSGNYPEAKTYAEKSLTIGSDAWNSGNLIHHGNMILGRIALQEGDVEKSKAYLLKSAETDGSPQMNSFGPNMSLAKDLLEKGERDVVLQYFEMCGKFWKRDRGQIKKWTDTVNAGKIPDFGANLDY